MPQLFMEKARILELCFSEQSKITIESFEKMVGRTTQVAPDLALPSGYAADFAQFGSGVRMAWNQSRQAGEHTVGWLVEIPGKPKNRISIAKTCVTM